jgi:hypothetical protein
MSWLLREQRWLWLAALAGAACTTYSDPPSGSADDDLAQSGAASGGTEAVAGKGGMGSATNGGTETSGSGGGSGGRVEPEAGTASGGATVAGNGGGGEPGTAGQGEGGASGCPDDDCCPADPNKTEPGACGCGIPDQDTAQLASCTSLKAGLVHRYDFEGGGKAVVDRVGNAHGTVEGQAEQSTVGGKGVLALVGNAAYVNLPNGLISSLTSVTIEAWVGWNGGKAWQRIFDFGESTAVPPENAQASGKDYLFLTPLSAYGSARFGFSLNGASNETAVASPNTFTATTNHVACIVDGESQKMLLYFNGKKTGEATVSAALSAVNDVNVWLGRSQYQSDPAFTGTFQDFRIYDRVLSAKELATSFVAGPDPTYLDP